MSRCSLQFIQHALALNGRLPTGKSWALGSHTVGPGSAPLSGHGGGGRVISLIWVAMLDLARRDIDNELGELRT